MFRFGLLIFSSASKAFKPTPLATGLSAGQGLWQQHLCKLMVVNFAILVDVCKLERLIDLKARTIVLPTQTGTYFNTSQFTSSSVSASPSVTKIWRSSYSPPLMSDNMDSWHYYFARATHLGVDLPCVFLVKHLEGLKNCLLLLLQARSSVSHTSPPSHAGHRPEQLCSHGSIHPSSQPASHQLPANQPTNQPTDPPPL